ncbi:MAG TPA: protein translocase SEC61 complex subunit gamma [Candidatus Bathyarchaeia archaeon]|nr:protein translocase SEC61 complex subunit gamma [Candidatus Bathyarchaeia archaeon]
MGLRSFFSSAAKMMKLAKKPGRDELWLSIKICILGIAVIGVVGFIIKFLSATLQVWSNY